MAKDTKIELRNKVIYQIFVRQYSNSSDFQGVIDDLERIKNLNVDYLYLLPIHPIGEVMRKGSVGSPYSIKDYRAIDNNLGGLKGFQSLIKNAHEKGMKIIMDIVFNHTSKDSLLTKEHPDWFYKNEDGSFKNRVGDWSDITDLNYNDEETIFYLVNTLKLYAHMGVDGFRFDVCSFLPYKFYKIARDVLKSINNDILFIGEAVNLDFCKYIRDLGYEVLSDGELYEVFDVLYDYDIFENFMRYFDGNYKLNDYLKEVMYQEARYPSNYCKLRYVSNHDYGSALGYMKDKYYVYNAFAMQGFFKGMLFIYNGLETLREKKIDLFEYDIIDFTKSDAKMVDLISKISLLKHNEIFSKGVINADYLNENVATLRLDGQNLSLYGIFSFDKDLKEVNVNLDDGRYLDILSNLEYEVKEKKICNSLMPRILKIN